MEENVQSYHQYLKNITTEHYYIIAQIRHMALDTYTLLDLLPDEDEQQQQEDDDDDDVDLLPDNDEQQQQQDGRCEIYDEFGIKVTKDYQGTFPDDQSSCGSQEIVIIYDHKQQEKRIDDATIMDMRISNNFTWNKLTYATKKSFENKILSKKHSSPLWW